MTRQINQITTFLIAMTDSEIATQSFKAIQRLKFSHVVVVSKAYFLEGFPGI